MALERQSTGIRTFLVPLKHEEHQFPLFSLFSQNQVVEILGRQAIQKVPLSPKYLKGVIGYRDCLVPVIDLDAFCGRVADGPQAGYRQFLVIRTGVVDARTGQSLKLVIGTNSGIHSVKFSNQMLGALSTEETVPVFLQEIGLLRGFFHYQGGGVALFDLSPLVQNCAAAVVASSAR